MPKHFIIAEDDQEDIDFYNEAATATGLPIIITAVVYCDGIFKSLDTSNLPHVIIIDGNLPGKSLLECINSLKAHDVLSKYPLVVLSGSLLNETKAKSYTEGINLFLEKPNRFDTLLEIFRRLYLMDWSNHSVLTSEEFYALAV